MSSAILSTLASSLVSPKDLYTELKRLAASNDNAANKEYRDQLDELTLELSRRYSGGWEDVNADERPTGDDVRRVAKEFGDAHDDASGPPKRKLLVNAFFGYFNPKFFREGMSKILWDYAVQLEYPDARYLRQLMEEVRAQITKFKGDSAIVGEHNRGASIEYLSSQRPLNASAIEFEYARRLGQIGLVELSHYKNRSYYVVSPRRELVEMLLEFLWADPAGTGDQNEGAESEKQDPT